MQEQLEAGKFYGRTLLKRCCGDLTLADVEYSPNCHVRRHSHERGYFCLIRRGSYSENYSRRVRICAPMMLVFHPPGERHSEVFGQEPVASFNVELGAEWLSRLRELGGTLDQPSEFRGDRITRLALRLFQEFTHQHSASDLAIESIVLEILAAYTQVQPVSDTTRRPGWLRRACDNLDASLHQTLSLKDVAGIAGVHPVYFATVFRHFNGCSVGEYVRRRRIEYARQMLANPEIPLSQVALCAGFADQSHFTRTYKRFTGRTPSQDRTFLLFKTRRKLGS